LFETVPRSSRGRADAEVRAGHHLFRMAVHAAGDPAAENGARGGSRQGALSSERSLVATAVEETSVPAGVTWARLSGFAETAIPPR
jgi:hypothetical protein